MLSISLASELAIFLKIYMFREREREREQLHVACRIVRDTVLQKKELFLKKNDLKPALLILT